MSAAVLVAVEEYAAGAIAGVRFAGHDVEGIGDALTFVGVEHADQRRLVNGAATKEAIESALREAISAIGAGETFYFYYVGHGFHVGADNYLTCHDSDKANLDGTSIRLEWLFALLREASCEQVVVFLDSCHRGLLAEREAGGASAGRSDSELLAFFGGEEHRVCLAPCHSDQLSWGSRRNKHGAWAFNVIEALRGEVPEALVRGASLTVGSLQAFLSSAVQKTLSKDFVERRDQDPWISDSHSDGMRLAEFGEVLQQRKEAAAPSASQVPRFRLCGEVSERIKKLSGFKGHQRVPSDVSRYAESLLRDASSDEIAQDLEGVYRRLRDEFGLRRKELEMVGPEDGGGSVACPYFTYSVYVAQSPDDPSRAVFHREISDVTEPERLLTGEFSRAFEGVFGALRFTPPVRVDLEAFIDRMEELDEQLQSIDFDPEGTYCQLRLHGVDAAIRVTATEIVLVHDTSREPRALIEAFSESQRFLVEKDDARLIPPER